MAKTYAAKKRRAKRRHDANPHRTSNPDMCGAVGDCRLKITAHPHGKARKAIARGHPGQCGEMRRRVLILGGDAHQPADRQGHGAAGGDEVIGLIGKDAGLLGLGACVDLNEQLGAPPDRLRQSCQLFSQ